MSLHVTTLTAQKEMERLGPEWIELLGRAKSDLPFVLPEWLLTWWETFRQNGPLLRDDLRLKVVRDDAGKLVSVVPLMMTMRPRVGPIRARALGFLGADNFITEQRTPIVDPAYEREVASALAADLLSKRDWDWVTWQGIDSQSTFGRELDRAMGLRWGTAETANIVHLAPTWDAFKSGLKRNIKESLRKCFNSLKRDGHEARLVVAETASDVERDLETFFKLHAMRAEQTGTITHPDRFAGARQKQFLRLVCARLAARGVARVFTLMIGEQPVAARVGFVLPETLYLYYSGFDPAWSKYSVATTIVAEAMKYAIERGLPRVHLSMGVDVAKSRWSPEMTVRCEATCVRSALTSRTALKLYSWGRNNAALGRTVGRLIPKRRFE